MKRVTFLIVLIAILIPSCSKVSYSNSISSSVSSNSSFSSSFFSSFLPSSSSGTSSISSDSSQSNELSLAGTYDLTYYNFVKYQNPQYEYFTLNFDKNFTVLVSFKHADEEEQNFLLSYKVETWTNNRFDDHDPHYKPVFSGYEEIDKKSNFGIKFRASTWELSSDFSTISYQMFGMPAQEMQNGEVSSYETAIFTLRQ